MNLVPVAAFPAIARRIGITATDRTLTLTGGLVRITVGRRDFYDLADIVAAAPGPRYPLITNHRDGLGERSHTITIERIDAVTARAWSPVHLPEDLLGVLAVVERSGGHLTKVCAVEPDFWGEVALAAHGTARAYGAKYVEVAA